MATRQSDTTKVHVIWSRVILGILLVALALGAPTQTLAAAAQPAESAYDSIIKSAEQAPSHLLAGLPGGYGAPGGGNLSGAADSTASLKPNIAPIWKKTLTIEAEKDLVSAVIDTANGFAYFGTNTSPGKIIKIRTSDNTREDALTLNTGEDKLTSAVIDTANGFAYFGTNTSPGRVVKVNLSTFTRVAAVTLNSGEDNLTSAVIDTVNGFAYFGTNTAPGIVVKVRLSDFTRVAAVTLNTGEDNLTSAVIDTANGFAYFGTNTTPGIVVKVNVNPASFARDAAVTLDDGTGGTNQAENNLTAAVIDPANDFAYFSTDSSSGLVVRVDIRPLHFQRSAQLNTQTGKIQSAVIDAPDGFAYFGGAIDQASAFVVKVDLHNFAFDFRIDLASDELNVRAAVIDLTDLFAFFGTSGSDPSSVVRVDVNAFHRVDAVHLNVGAFNFWAAVIDPTAGFVYFATYTQPGIIAKVRLSDFTAVATLALAPGEDGIRSAVIDTVNHFAYFGTGTSPGKVVKVNLTTFTEVGALTLNSGENSLVSAVIDTTAGFAYFGTDTQPGMVVKVNLPTFTEDATVVTGGTTNTTQEDSFTSAVIVFNSNTTYGYFGTNTSPGIVVKVQLAPDFVRLNGLELNSGEDFLTSAVVDPGTKIAYFGTNTISPAGQVVKVNVGSTFARTASFTTSASRLSSAVIDPPDGFAYFGSQEQPGQVVQVGINPFQTGSANTLPMPGSNEDFLTSAIYANGCAYFGAGDDTAGNFGSGYNPRQSSNRIMKIQVDPDCRNTTKTVIISHNPKPSVVGQSIVINFSVTSPDGTPTGNVTVSDGTVNCTASVAVGACILTPTSAGNKTLTAAYAGDALFNVSSGTVSHQVNGDATATSITSHTPDPSNVNQAVVVNYIVIAASGTPAGNVKVTDGTVSCTGTVAAGTCTLTPTSAGTKTLKATYQGNSTFSPSSGTVSHTVQARKFLFLPLMMR